MKCDPLFNLDILVHFVIDLFSIITTTTLESRNSLEKETGRKRTLPKQNAEATNSPNKIYWTSVPYQTSQKSKTLTPTTVLLRFIKTRTTLPLPGQSLTSSYPSSSKHASQDTRLATNKPSARPSKISGKPDCLSALRISERDGMHD